MLATYITAHGFGHAARTCDVLAALRKQRPELPMVVVSELPSWFVETRLPGVPQRRASFDVGMVQADGVAVDMPATLQRITDLNQRWDSLLAQERVWLREQGVRLVASDVPALPIQAAASESVPTVALSNFSWDWLYGEFLGQDPNWDLAASRFRAAYQGCDLLLRYPFHCPMEAFQKVEDIPVVAAPGTARREEFAKLLGADPALPWLLLVFSSLEFSAAGKANLAKLSQVQLLSTGELNWEGENVFGLSPSAHNFADLVATVDAVVTKPGFGILSDCVANQKPLVYVNRDHFREAEYTRAGIRRWVPNYELPLADLYEGRLGPVLEALSGGLPQPTELLESNGAAQVARRLLELYG